MAATTMPMKKAIQSMPLVSSFPEIRLKIQEPARAPTAPSRIVIPREMFCLPGSTKRARGPMMMPARRARRMVVNMRVTSLATTGVASPGGRARPRTRGCGPVHEP
jgi:hypothetical protein